MIFFSQYLNKIDFYIDAWIITAGTNAGVVKEVGEALNKYRYKSDIDGVDIVCIGIGSWGYTAGKDQIDCFMLPTNTNSKEVDNSINKGQSGRIIDAVQLVISREKFFFSI